MNLGKEVRGIRQATSSPLRRRSAINVSSPISIENRQIDVSK